jgi:hypothetical protein
MFHFFREFSEVRRAKRLSPVPCLYARRIHNSAHIAGTKFRGKLPRIDVAKIAILLDFMLNQSIKQEKNERYAVN